MTQLTNLHEDLSTLTPEARYEAAVENYLKNLKYQGRSQKTLNNYAQRLDLFYRFWTGRYPEGAPGDPSYSDVEAWRDDMVDNGLAASTVAQYLAEVRYFFQAMSDPELEEARVYTKNPVAKRLVPKVPAKPYKELLTPEQIAALFVNRRAPKARQEFWPRNYAMVILLLTTGIRNAELLDLTPADLEWDEAEDWGLLTVRHGKGNKYRVVDLPKIAWLAVQLYLKSGIRPADAGEHDPLFGTTTEHAPLPQPQKAPWHKGCTTWLSEVVERHVRAVTGVDGITSHDLRHVFSRLALTGGVSMELLQGELGHASMSTTQRYSGLLTAKRQMKAAGWVFAQRDREEKALEQMILMA